MKWSPFPVHSAPSGGGEYLGEEPGLSDNPEIFSNEALAAIPPADELLAACEHVLGCYCKPCFWIRRHVGPIGVLRCNLAAWMARALGALPKPPRKKRDLRNESRRITRLRRTNQRLRRDARLAEKRAVVASILQKSA